MTQAEIVIYTGAALIGLGLLSLIVLLLRATFPPPADKGRPRGDDTLWGIALLGIIGGVVLLTIWHYYLSK